MNKMTWDKENIQQIAPETHVLSTNLLMLLMKITALPSKVILTPISLYIYNSVPGFLCIGLSSVKRQRGSYLVTTLQSLFSQSSPAERSSMVVVVLLADFDVDWRVATVKEIQTTFPSELEQGQLLVLHVTKEWYPNTTGTQLCSLSFLATVTLLTSGTIHYVTVGADKVSVVVSQIWRGTTTTNQTGWHFDLSRMLIILSSSTTAPV